jgi:DNA-binding response OmpR family regulator
MPSVSVALCNRLARVRQSFGQGSRERHTIGFVTRVLLVEDDRDIAEPLARALTREGYDVSSAGDGRVALERVLDAPPDLIILDVGLPGMNGLEVCRHVREARPQVPIVMLTARDGELETVAGLDAGADDYVTKPFRLSVLLARVRAALRRGAPPEHVVGDVRVDEVSRRAWRGQRELELSPKEFDLLAVLIREAGKVVPRERIMDEVWDVNWFGSTKTLDMHMSWLRRKLGDPPLITTVRRVGFRFER